MKKVLSVIMTVIMLASMALSAFAVDFSDLITEHWAYNYVNALVADGTINGFDDGTFRPEDTVTRAQFVKMIGKGPEVRENEFNDVPKSHWAYEYIMSSGLEPFNNNNMFIPDTAITRGDVAVLLWKRAGSPKGIIAPPIINRQGTNYDAVSWVYSNGIMVGNDYIDLRLGDTLTRAEASALIIRSREVNKNTPKTDFAGSIDSGIYEKIFTSFKLIDREYSANATLTNGELAMAVARLQSGMDSPTYPGLSADITFEHKYAQPINMIARYYAGMENDNAKYADKNATVKEAIAAIMFAVTKSFKAYTAPESTGTYPTYRSNGNKEFDRLISEAYNSGVMAYEAPTLNMNKAVTMKELAQIVLECNGFAGFHYATKIKSPKSINENIKIRANTATYPNNADDYRIIVEDLPNYVYETPFVSARNLPKDNYKLSNTFKEIFTYMLSSWVKIAQEYGYQFEIMYYPGMVVEDGTGYTLRCRLDVKRVSAGSKLADIIECVNEDDGATFIVPGSSIFVDISTGKQLDGVDIGTEKMVLTQVIR